MGRRQVLKVKTSALMRNIEAYLDRAPKEYAEQLARYFVELNEYRWRYMDALGNESARVYNGGEPKTTNWGGGISLDVGGTAPTKPQSPDMRIARAREDLALLKMADDSAITVSDDSNWRTYLG